MSSNLQRIVVKPQLQTQLRPAFLNPICLQTFQNLPKIYGHIKIKKNLHKQKKAIFQSTSQSQIQACQTQKKQQILENKYFQNNLKSKKQDFEINKNEQFQKTLAQRKLSKSQDQLSKQLRCKCKKNGKISALSLQKNGVQWINNRGMRKTSQSSPNDLIKNNKMCFSQQSQINHKVHANLQLKHINFCQKNKNKGLLSLIRQVNQKSQENYNSRTKSQNFKTPGRSTHYRINSMEMQKIDEQYLQQQQNNKLKTKNKFGLKSKSIQKNIKIVKNDISIKPIKKTSFKKSFTQPNQKDSQFQQHKTQYKKHLNLKNYQQKKNNFHVPQKQEISLFLKNYKPILQNFNLKQIIKSQSFTIIYDNENSSVYAGQTKNQLKHGRGIKISRFSIFQGQFKNGFKKFGVEITKDGFYKGSFKNQKREGQGIFNWNNGQIFEGKWQNNFKQGFGKWVSPKGDQYEGNWSFNKQNGYGIFKCNLSVYKGIFKDFLKHGDGQQYFKNGDKYIGEYQNGKPFGKGIYYWKDGQTYQGQFVNGLRQGHGILQTASGEFYKAKANSKMISSTEKAFLNNWARRLCTEFFNMEKQQKINKCESYLVQNVKNFENEYILFLNINQLIQLII